MGNRLVARVTSSLGAGFRSLRAVFHSRVDWLAIVPGALVIWAATATVLPPRSGPPAMVMAVEQLLFLAVVAVLAPIALWRRARTLAAAILVCVVMGGCLFGSEWISLPGSGASRHDLAVMTWNVQAGARSPADQAAALEGLAADLVALQEVEPDAADAITGDPTLAARYPYRAMAPRRGTWGLAVLSRYPISSLISVAYPAILDLIVATPRGSVHVIDAHPYPPELYTVTPIRAPVAYDPSGRDAEIAVIRSQIEAALAAGDRLLVLGDFNTTPSEAEYRTLAAGLHDAHVEVGQGPGWTWRPSRLTFLPFGFIRIDLQLSAGAIRPASTSIDCSLPGDHCRLFADYEID